MGLYYEDWMETGEHRTPAVTVTEAHVVDFCSITQILSAIHMDKEYARTRPGGTGERLVPGMLTLSLGLGLSSQFREGTVIAFVGMDNVRFTKPVKFGDTISAVEKVLETKETKNPQQGFVKILNSVRNQDDEEVCRAEYLMLFARRPK